MQLPCPRTPHKNSIVCQQHELAVRCQVAGAILNLHVDKPPAGAGRAQPDGGETKALQGPAGLVASRQRRGLQAKLMHSAGGPTTPQRSRKRALTCTRCGPGASAATPLPSCRCAAATPVFEARREGDFALSGMEVCPFDSFLGLRAVRMLMPHELRMALLCTWQPAPGVWSSLLCMPRKRAPAVHAAHLVHKQHVLLGVCAVHAALRRAMGRSMEEAKRVLAPWQTAPNFQMGEESLSSRAGSPLIHCTRPTGSPRQPGCTLGSGGPNSLRFPGSWGRPGWH